MGRRLHRGSVLEYVLLLLLLLLHWHACCCCRGCESVRALLLHGM
jgi:hypothetical protein